MHGKRGVRRAARKLGLAALGVNDISVFAIAHQDAAHITDIVQKAGDDHVRVVAVGGRHQQRSALHDVVADERHQHGMFDGMVERVAVANALKRQPGDRWNKFGKTGLRRTKAPFKMRGKEIPQRLGGQFGNGNHKASNWIAKHIVAAACGNCNTGSCTCTGSFAAPQSATRGRRSALSASKSRARAPDRGAARLRRQPRYERPQAAGL